MLKRMKNVKVYKGMYIMFKEKDVLCVIGCSFLYFIEIEKGETNNKNTFKIIFIIN